MRSIVNIPFKTWIHWTPEERAQVSEYYAQLGVRWMLDLSGVDDRMGNEIEKDYDEYREEMSIGGRPFKFP
jgi:hypothetical protein